MLFMHINSVNGYYILCFRNAKGCFTFSAYKANKAENQI